MGYVAKKVCDVRFLDESFHFVFEDGTVQYFEIADVDEISLEDRTTPHTLKVIDSHSRKRTLYEVSPDLDIKDVVARWVEAEDGSIFAKAERVFHRTDLLIQSGWRDE